MEVTRRRLIGVGATAAAGVLAPTAWLRALASAPTPTPGERWGPLGEPDANGIRLPGGFSSRLVARSGDEVGSTGYLWHHAPDGGACFSRPDGGWVYTSNAEVGNAAGGASSIGFDAAGDIDAAYKILSGTSINCSGGATPWNTWLSCEERGDGGHVHECDPYQPGQGIVRPLLGSFNHEGAAHDPGSNAFFLTEDKPLGRLYRFDPTTPGDLSSGQLWAASVSVPPRELGVGESAAVVWRRTSSNEPDRSVNTTEFAGGEGVWVDGTNLYFTTKIDRRVWRIDLSTDRLELIHDCIAAPSEPFSAVDTLVVHQPTRDVFVAEDGGEMRLVALSERPDGTHAVSVFMQFLDQDSSEVTGPAFSPDGTKLYVSSQRGTDGRGLTYEISGPFSNASPMSGLATHDALRPAVRLSSS